MDWMNALLSGGGPVVAAPSLYDRKYGALPPAGQPQQADPGVPAEENIDVVGFKPTKRNLLGKIFDVMAGAPNYENRMRQKDMQRIMSGFQDDPKRAIDMIARHVDPEKAWSMYDTHQDNLRGDITAGATAEQKAGDRMAKGMKFVGGILGRALQDGYDTNQWAGTYARIKDFASKRGFELPEGLTDTYNRDAIEEFYMGNVDPEDQIRIEALQSYRKRALDLREDQINRTDEDRDDSEEIRQEGNSIRREGNAIRRDNGKNTGKSSKAEAGGKRVSVPGKGSGVMSPSGNTLKLDSGAVYQKQADGNFKRIR